MTAVVLPFPPSRRRDFVWRQARHMAELSPEAAERHLQRQLRVQGETMSRRRIAPATIDAELRQLERSIRTALFSVRHGQVR